MTFDPSKPVQTRAGKPARILCTDFKDQQKIVAAVEVEPGLEVIQMFWPSGIWGVHERDVDLVNVPESKWMNIYDTPGHNSIPPFSTWYNSREEADLAASSYVSWHRLAVVERTDFGNMFITKVDK